MPLVIHALLPLANMDPVFFMDPTSLASTLRALISLTCPTVP